MQRPLAGVGIGLRREHYGEIATCSRALDFLEIVPENFIGHGGAPLRLLDACAERWPIAVHGVSLSLGGPDPFDRDHLDRLRALLDRLGAAFYSDHLCYASVGGVAFFDLLPLPFTTAAAQHAAARIIAARERLGRPIAVENITYYATMPGSVLDEGAFVHEVCERADCSLLLDVANVYVNAMNHGRDPLEVLSALPLERTVQIHLAGFCPEAGRLIDDHGAAIAEPVWALYEAAIARLGPIPTLVERDNAIPPLDRLLDEADRARAIQRDVARARDRGAA